jgi:hypothetical protein
MLETADNQPVNAQLAGINKYFAVKIYTLSRATPRGQM